MARYSTYGCSGTSEGHCRKTRPNRLNATLRLLFGLSSASALTPSMATTITVNTAQDEIADNGKCSLREALASAGANSAIFADCPAGSGADTIVFEPTVFPPNTLTAISLVSGELVISGDAGAGGWTSISGNGVVALDAQGADRVLQILSVSGQPPVYASLNGLTIRNGSSGNGGGIANYGGQLLIDQCTITGNTASGEGGGIFMIGGSGLGTTGGTLRMTNSTLSGNQAVHGGGIDVGSSGFLLPSIVQSTISGNSAATGGGIYIASGPFDLNFVTMTDNTGGGLAIKQVANTYSRWRNSIAADSAGGGSCIVGSGFVAPQDLGSNIDNGATCGFTAAAGSFPNTDPKLGPLADYGGLTLTYKPTPGSAAVDRITCAAGGFDQRGVPRPQGLKCDIGAVELEDTIFENGFEMGE